VNAGLELAEGAARLLRERLTTADLRRAASEVGILTDLWSEGREQGWFEITLPERFGGLGLDTTAVLPMLKELGRRIVPGPLIESMLVLPACLEAGDEGAAAALLAHVVHGHRVALVNLGSDPRSPGDDLRLEDGRLHGGSGAVRWASTAEALIVGAKSGAESVVLWVDRGTPGVTVTGTAPHGTCERVEHVRFDGVEVGSTNLLFRGAAAEDFREMVVGPIMRIGLAAELAGTCETMLEMSTDYVMVRHQFDRPIGTFQAIQHLLADAAVSTYALSCLVDAAIEDMVVDPSTLAVRSWVLKAVAARTSRQVAETSLQVHGGIGVTAEHDLHLYMKRVLAVQGLWGEIEELEIRFAEHNLSAAR
jgi:alkylation response protein AidB-like acyl-CoA dehydrogenase